MTKIKFLVPVLAFATFSTGVVAEGHGHHAHKSKADSSYFGFDTGYGYGAYGQHFKGQVTSGTDDITSDNADFDFPKTTSLNQSIFYGYHLSDDFRLELSLNNHQYRERIYTQVTEGIDVDTTTSGDQSYATHSMLDGGIVDLLLSGYFDFQTDQAWTPYVGLGIGYGSAHYKEFFSSAVIDTTWSTAVGTTALTTGTGSAYTNDSQQYSLLGRTDKGLFTYQAALGIKFDMSQCSTFDIGYKYHGGTAKELTVVETTDQDQFARTFKFRPGSHSMSIGATYKF